MGGGEGEKDTLLQIIVIAILVEFLFHAFDQATSKTHTLLSFHLFLSFLGYTFKRLPSKD